MKTNNNRKQQVNNSYNFQKKNTHSCAQTHTLIIPQIQQKKTHTTT